MGTGDKRPFFNRTFRKLEKGGVRSSIFSLCSSAIGSGVLSLPFVMALCGFVIGGTLFVVGAIGAIWSLYILADCAIETGQPNYNSIAKKAGGKYLMRALQIIILIYVFGTVTSY